MDANRQASLTAAGINNPSLDVKEEAFRFIVPRGGGGSRILIVERNELIQFAVYNL